VGNQIAQALMQIFKNKNKTYIQTKERKSRSTRADYGLSNASFQNHTYTYTHTYNISKPIQEVSKLAVLYIS
jgi:hypothetical protein